MFHKWVLGSNIVIGVYIPGMGSVLLVPYVGVGIYYSDRSVCTGQVVSAVYSVCRWWDLI